MQTTLCLVRHGETAWNAERRIQGQLDLPLNDTGLAQAEAAAAALAAQDFAAVYCSDLGRARETARPIAERLGLALQSDVRLRERHYGGFQGLTYSEAEQRYPDDYLRFAARDADFALPDGGESLTTFARRVHDTLADLAARYAGQRVVVVTHGGVLDAAYRLATARPLSAARDFLVANAALNWIAHTDDAWRLLSWGECDHLADTRDELPRG